MLGNVNELFATSRLFIIVHSDSSFEVMQMGRSPKNTEYVVFLLQECKTSTSEKYWWVIFECLLTKTHKVTIDLYNFLETLMNAYVEVAEI